MSTDVGLAAAREARAYRNLTQTYRYNGMRYIYVEDTHTHTRSRRALPLESRVSTRYKAVKSRTSKHEGRSSNVEGDRCVESACRETATAVRACPASQTLYTLLRTPTLVTLCMVRVKSHLRACTDAQEILRFFGSLLTTVCQTPWHLRMGGGSCSSQSFSGLRYYDRNDDRGMARDARANLRRRGLDLRHRALELRLHRLLERIACDSHGASQQRHHHNHRRVTVTTTTDASP